VNLVLFEPAEVMPGGLVTIDDARATHLLHVLKVTEGDTVRVGIVDGGIGAGTVAAVGDGRVTLQCAIGALPPRPPVDLLLALPRPKVMRRLWAQLSALGVARVMLTNAERVERNYFDTHVLAPECYRPLLIEGLQQARDTRVPTVTIHRQFRRLVEDELAALSDAPARLVAHPDATTTMREALAARGGHVLLAVGPEGGWNDFELKLLDAHAFQRVSMGSRTLRSDTACVALMALLHEAIRATPGR
jgi:16S rRNA (uracil1498-N3)-methyltransferase